LNSLLPSQALTFRERLAQFYKTSWAYAEHLAQEDGNYFRRYLSLVNKYGTEAGTLLDAGCGTGLSSYLLSEGKRKVVGIDLSELFLQQGRREDAGGNLLLAAADILNLPFQDQSFDLVGSYLVVEFLPDVPRGVEEMIRVLRKGGILLMVTPNLLSPVWPLRDFFHIVLGGSPRPVWCENARSALATFWRNLLLTVKKGFQRKSEFLYREPDLTCQRVVGRDSDSVYLACPQDLVLFLKGKGFRILRKAGSSTWVERFFPSLSTAVEVVAQKI